MASKFQAYVALVSLINTLEQILNPPRHWIRIEEKQLRSLLEKVYLFTDFLENAGDEDMDELQTQMVSSAYAAEAIVESTVSSLNRARFRVSVEENFTSFGVQIQKIQDEFDAIAIKVTSSREKGRLHDRVSQKPSPPVSSRLAADNQNRIVGLDEKIIVVMDKLTGSSSKLEISAIVGMGGIGKTTLARHVFDNPYIVHHFHIRAWIEISQQYTVRDVLLDLLSQVIGYQRKQEPLAKFADRRSTLRDDEVGELLYKNLSGWTYFIVMDDLWATDIWNEIGFFFPDNSNGSKILMTTRLSNVAVKLSFYPPFEMEFLNDEQSWQLLRQTVFGQEGCPKDFLSLGQEIAKQCMGLPLPIVVIGGLLAKSEKKLVVWENISQNLMSNMDSTNDEKCRNVLALSYSNLPIELKPCLLHMAVVPRSHSSIESSSVVKIWIAEGFLRSVKDKSLEEVGFKYLQDLIDRNLILDYKNAVFLDREWFNLHDLVRDLCLKEAEKENFGVKESRTTKVRFNFSWPSEDVFPEEIEQLENLRFLQFKDGMDSNSALKVPSSISLMWNLQVLIIMNRKTGVIILPLEIWEMPQIRHLEFKQAFLPEPPCLDIDDHGFYVLKHLQNLVGLVNFRITTQVLERVPNLKMLIVTYNSRLPNPDLSYFCLSNLFHFQKLEELICRISGKISVEELNFPLSLKALALNVEELTCEDMTFAGSLPNLERFGIHLKGFVDNEWQPIEGQFARLKHFTLLEQDLLHWRANETHFPVLEDLILIGMKLEEIPLELGEIPTLRLIELQHCSDSTIFSAKQIVEEQESMGNESLKVVVKCFGPRQDLLSLESENFVLKIVEDIRH